MKLEGKIIVAQPIQSGVSKNGNNWQRQDFVLEIPGQYPKKGGCKLNCVSKE